MNEGACVVDERGENAIGLYGEGLVKGRGDGGCSGGYKAREWVGTYS